MRARLHYQTMWRKCYAMLNKNIETFLGCEGEYTDARIVLFGAPFDSTTSYRPGTRFASRTMRAESYGLETYSPYQDLDMEDAAVFDGGDLELCFGDTEKALASIHDFTAEVIADKKKAAHDWWGTSCNTRCSSGCF